MSTYEKHMLENSALPFIFREGAVRQRRNLFGASNWHENIEILFITAGKGAVSNNAQQLEVEPGDIVVINANHLHALGAYGETLCYRYLIVDRSFCLFNHFDTNAISFHALVRDTALGAMGEELARAYDTNAPYRTLRIRSLVLRIMEQLCLFHSQPAEALDAPKRIIGCIKQAINYIHASFDQSFSLDDVAEFVGLNRYYLSHEFRKYTGYSFVEYVNRTRCERAQQRLTTTDADIGEVGRQCGFESRSYFAKCFQKYIGMLPSEYRQRAKN